MNQFYKYFFSIILAGIFTNTFAAVVVPPPVQKWKFHVESGFTVTASTAGGPAFWINPKTGAIPKKLATGIIGSNPSVEPSFAGAPSTLSWGNGSSISVGGATGGHHEGEMITNGGMVNTVAIEFKNGLNDGSQPSLTYAGLMDGAWSDAVAPNFYEQGIPGTGENHQPLFWHIYYMDTPDSAACLSTGCVDIAVVEPMGMIYSQEQGVFAANFDYFGHTYTSLLKIEGVNPLDDSICQKLGKSGCVGIFLPEGRDATLHVSVGVNAVPLPPSVWMLGSAFGFLTLFFRNKNSVAT